MQLFCNSVCLLCDDQRIARKMFMQNSNLVELFSRFDHVESQFCIVINRSSRRAYIRYFFTAISRLGDGVFWYTLALCLPYLNGNIGWLQALHVFATGLVGLLIYKFLKQRLVRERPYIHSNVIHQAAPALDQYSFPSGHTLHAVLFSVLLSSYIPELSSLIWGFTCLVALSRVVLGLHYPSDVLAGMIIGFAIATLSSNFLII